MRIKTSDLVGPALDWAVRYATDGRRPLDYVEARDNFGSCWNKCGPIIERELIEVSPSAGAWRATPCRANYPDNNPPWLFGSTPIIAAMRCYVASKLGDIVDVPEQLTK